MATWKQAILNILKSGHTIRVDDGRWTNGFVGTSTLTKMIDNGELETFEQDGITMARLSQDASTRAASSADRAK